MKPMFVYNYKPSTAKLKDDFVDMFMKQGQELEELFISNDNQVEIAAIISQGISRNSSMMKNIDTVMRARKSQMIKNERAFSYGVDARSSLQEH